LEFDELSNQVIGCALEVHKQIGPGLLESAYEQCLAHELSLSEFGFQRQVPLPVTYKNIKLDCGYRLDFLVEDTLVVELKSVERILPLYKAQILSYMRLANIPVGLLINFNVMLLKDGIRRFVL
jgi:GxxExxY protein